MRSRRFVLLFLRAASLVVCFVFNDVPQHKVTTLRHEAKECHEPCKCCWNPTKTDNPDLAGCEDHTTVDEQCDVLYEDGFTHGSSLAHAARLNNPYVVKQLLSFNAAPDTRDRRNRTALFHATAGVIKLLVDGGAAIDAKDSVGRTFLCIAAWKGDVAAVDELLTLGASVDEGMPPPLYCSRGFPGGTTAVQLIVHGATIGAMPMKLTTLREAAQGAAEVMKWDVVAELLGKHQVELCYVEDFIRNNTNSSETIASFALARKYWGLVGTLVREELIDCNFVGEKGRTVFMAALAGKEGAVEVADLCCNETNSSGHDLAALSHRDIDGYNVLMLAIKYDYHRVSELIKRAGRFELLDKHADNGDRALTLAMSEKYPEWVHELIRAGAKELNLIKGTESVLSFLLGYGGEQMIEDALHGGADPNLRIGPFNRSAIFEATSPGEVHMLADHRASLDLQDANGQTALMIFAQGGWDRKFISLLARGANASILDKDDRNAWSYLHKESLYIGIDPTGYTRTHWAVLGCDAQAMVANGDVSELFSKAQDGKTPVKLAEENKDRCRAAFEYCSVIQKGQREAEQQKAKAEQREAEVKQAKERRRQLDHIAGIVTVVLTSATICVLHLFSYHMTLVKDTSMLGRALSFVYYFAVSFSVAMISKDEQLRFVGWLACGTSSTFFVTMLVFCWDSRSVISRTVRPIKLKTTKWFDRLIWRDVEMALKVATGFCVLALELRGVEPRTSVVISSLIYFSWPMVEKLVGRHGGLAALLETSVGFVLVAWPLYLFIDYRMGPETSELFELISSSPLFMGACSLATSEIRLARLAANHVEDTCVEESRSRASDDMSPFESALSPKEKWYARLATCSNAGYKLCMRVLGFLLVAQRLRHQRSKMLKKMEQMPERETVAIARVADFVVGGVEESSMSTDGVGVSSARALCRANSAPATTFSGRSRVGSNRSTASSRVILPPTTRNPASSGTPSVLELTRLRSASALRRSSLASSLDADDAYDVPDIEEEPDFTAIAVDTSMELPEDEDDEEAAEEAFGDFAAEVPAARPRGFLSATRALLHRSMSVFRLGNDDAAQASEDMGDLRSSGRRHTIADAGSMSAAQRLRSRRKEHEKTFPEQNRFVVRTLEFGRSQVAARGIKHIIGWEKEPPRGEAVQRMFEEVERTGNKDYIEIFKYVWKGKDDWQECKTDKKYPRSIMQSIELEQYHGGVLKEEDFDCEIQGASAQEIMKKNPKARSVGLTEAEIVAVRFYTSSAYPLINDPLRELLKKAVDSEPHDEAPRKATSWSTRATMMTNYAAASASTDLGDNSLYREGGHPWKHVVYYLETGIKKLRGVDAGKQNFLLKRTFWRGMKNVFLDVDQLRYHGGVEMAPTSTTKNQRVALAYSRDQASLLFKYKVCGMNRGVLISWLSLFPKEEEYLYPPLTLLHYLRHYQDDNLRIVEVEPQIS